MDSADRVYTLGHGTPVVVQDLREARGGMSYDLRPPSQVRRNDFAQSQANGRRTLVFHGVDQRSARFSVNTSPTREKEVVIHSQARGHVDADREAVDRASSEDLSMPHLERRPSQSDETDPRIDDLYISTSPRPLFDEGRCDNAGRPRTLMSKTFGSVFSRPCWDDRFAERHPENDHFSDRFNLPQRRQIHHASNPNIL